MRFRRNTPPPPEELEPLLPDHGKILEADPSTVQGEAPTPPPEPLTQLSGEHRALKLGRVRKAMQDLPKKRD